MPDLYESLSLILLRDVAHEEAAQRASAARAETRAGSSGGRAADSTPSRRSRLGLVPVRRPRVLALDR